MAIYLPDYDASFLHIAKTGGLWVEEALFRTQCTTRFISSPQDDTCADRHCTKDSCPDAKFTFAFIRHPLHWYASWWTYSAGRPHNWDRWHWHPTYPLQRLRHVDFGEFIQRVIDHAPGFLTKMFEQYTGPLEKPNINFIGRTENLKHDFCCVLDAIGHPYDPTVLDNLPPQNAGGSVVGHAIWREDQEQQLLKLEHKIVEFYDAIT